MLVSEKEFLSQRILDVFTVDEFASMKALIWYHEGREISETLVPFYDDENMQDVRNGSDPGTFFDVIAYTHSHGDRLLELYDPQGSLIYDGHAALKAELENLEIEYGM